MAKKKKKNKRKKTMSNKPPVSLLGFGAAANAAKALRERDFNIKNL